MVKEASRGPSLSSIPDPALSRLDDLVGAWDITGRTLDSQPGNITGYDVIMTQVSSSAKHT